MHARLPEKEECHRGDALEVSRVKVELQRFYADRRVWVVFGVMRDKAVAEIASLLFPLAHRIILTRPDNSRAMPPESIPAPGATLTHSVSEALLAVREASPEDVVLITGSLYVVGEARAALVK